MSKSFAAPRTIRRIAARRVFKSPGRKPIVMTLGVPQPVPGSDWGCALQITGLKTSWRRPKYVFGIDGLQALHLAMKCATAVLESAAPELAWWEKDKWECPGSCPTYRSLGRRAFKRSSNEKPSSSGEASSALTRQRLRSAGSRPGTSARPDVRWLVPASLLPLAVFFVTEERVAHHGSDERDQSPRKRADYHPDEDLDNALDEQKVPAVSVHR